MISRPLTHSRCPHSEPIPSRMTLDVYQHRTAYTSTKTTFIPIDRMKSKFELVGLLIEPFQNLNVTF